MGIFFVWPVIFWVNTRMQSLTWQVYMCVCPTPSLISSTQPNLVLIENVNLSGSVKAFSRPPGSSLVQVCVCMTHVGSDLQVHSTGSHVERRAFTSVPTILGPHHPIHMSKSCSNPQPPTLVLLPLWHLESLQLWSPMPGIPGMLKVLLGIVSSDGNTRPQPSSHSYYRIPIAHSTKLPRTPLLRTEGLPPCHLLSLCRDNKNILTKALTKVRRGTSAMAVNTGRAHWIY